MSDLQAALPAPDIIEPLDFEAILAGLMADAADRFAAAGIAYDVGNLETDPVKIVLEAAAYREVLLRARVNDAARANILPFSRGVDLDYLAGFYDVVRLPDETDARLRQRVLLAIQGRSTAGPEERYMAVTMAADPRIAACRVYLVDGGPKLRIALLSSEDGGAPDADMIEAVTDAVTAPGVRVVNDVIEVVAAVSVVAPVTAKMWLLPDAPVDLVAALPQVLADAWMAEGGIGFDLDPDWISARLFVAGVSDVEIVAPASRLVVDDNNAVSLGAIDITFAGRRR